MSQPLFKKKKKCDSITIENVTNVTRKYAHPTPARYRWRMKMVTKAKEMLSTQWILKAVQCSIFYLLGFVKQTIMSSRNRPFIWTIYAEVELQLSLSIYSLIFSIKLLALKQIRVSPKMLDDSFWLANCDCPDRGKDWCLIFFKKLCLSIWSRCFQNVGHSKCAYTKLMFWAFLLFLFHNLVEEYLQGNLKSMLLLYETRWLYSESAPSTFIHNTIVTWRQDPHRFFPQLLDYCFFICLD